MNMQTNFIQQTNQYGESYRISYNAWGDPAADKVLLCIHGLNRNSRDFDFLAEYMLQHGYYIVAPDLPGRGNSDYLNDYRGYNLESNLVDLCALISQLELTNIDLVGVSLGGLLGLFLAAYEHKPIRRLVLNDIGAEIEKAGVLRIAGYSKEQPDFASLAEAREYFQQNSLSDGIFDETIWQHVVMNSFHRNSAKRWELKRDVKIALSLADGLLGDGNIEFWQYWQAVTAPTLIIHGQKSDILTLATIHKMQQINLLTEVLSVDDAGHSPYLYRKAHFDRLAKFLLQ